ncbi:MAG: recombination protein RecR [Anaerolineaceae bacterium]|nr:recombination protein RecR [Anaerolineaceae bacterium]
MALLPQPLQDLIFAFEKLPGIGPKSASRLAFFMLKAPSEIPSQLADALNGLKDSIGFCKKCFNITLSDRDLCQICSDEKRDGKLLCIVEDPMDVLALERTDGFFGCYHVLHGVLSPIEGIGPEDLKIRPLIKRIETEDIQEIIIATNPSMEGDATALYIHQQLGDSGIRITRLARGLPVGSDIEYADQNTILRALAGRQDILN